MYLIIQGIVLFSNVLINIFLSLQKIGESEMNISLAKPPSEKKKMEKR